MTPHKTNSGKPKELAKGPKNSKEELLFNGGFQESTKKKALLGKNLKDKGLEESRISADNTIHNNQTSESDSEYDSDSDEESNTESSGPESDETSEFQDDEDVLDEGDRNEDVDGEEDVCGKEAHDSRRVVEVLNGITCLQSK